jgi:4-hydroxybenzoate polyprenyltransferase
MALLRDYARLLRLPLFVTAAADSVAAYAIASLGAGTAFDWRVVPLLAGASSGLYLFGMVENDLADVERDRLLGTKRPLATGSVTVRGALRLLIGTMLLTILCVLALPGEVRGPVAFLAVAAFAAVNLYNLGAKGGPAPIAMSVMGLCRLLNCGLGIVAAVGIPRGTIDWGLLAPSGPLWMRHALAVAFTAAMASGYSIAVRRGRRVSSRPWQGAAIIAVAAGLAMWMLAPAVALAQADLARLVPPVARVFAVVVLALLWPGRLWSAAGPERKPAEYGRFIERALYWLIVADAAFVLDAMLVYR